MASPEHSGGSERREGLDAREVRRIALVGAVLLVAILALVFIVENSRSVPVSFVFFTADISLIWVIVLSMAIGAGLGVLIKRYVRKRFFSDKE